LSCLLRLVASAKPREGKQGHGMSDAIEVNGTGSKPAVEERYRQEFERHRRWAGAFVISFPKSGRTWHRALLGYYLARRCGERPEDAFQLSMLCKKNGIGNVIYSHNAANFIDGLPWDHPLVASPELWRDKPVLLLVRNPKDVLVSAHHHAVYRGNVRRVRTFSKFVRHRTYGVKKILTALNRWHDNRHLASRFEVVSYEQMHRSPADALSKALDFMGVEDIDQALVAEAVEFCRFDSIQEKEVSGFFNTRRLGGKRQKDSRARKVREGRVGGYRDYIWWWDERYIDDCIAEMGNPYAEMCRVPELTVSQKVFSRFLRPLLARG
jgi:hypothetical protein